MSVQNWEEGGAAVCSAEPCSRLFAAAEDSARRGFPLINLRYWMAMQGDELTKQRVSSADADQTRSSLRRSAR